MSDTMMFNVDETIFDMEFGEVVEVDGGSSSGSGSVPSGGKAGQYLCKRSDNDYDVMWTDLIIPEQYGLVTYDQDKTITIT